MRPHLVLTFDFPPMGGGIARWLAEVARCYPPGEMVVSTGAWPDSAASDTEIHQRVDRLAIHATRLKTLPGLLRWSHRAEELVRELSPDFIWCGNLKPAGYPARWVHARSVTPYGIIFHGTDLLKLEHHAARSSIRRATARTVIGSAAVYVTNSRWTAGVCERVLQRLGFDPARRGPVRVVPLGTSPDRFRPGLDSRAVRARYGLGEGRWLLTVARLVEHKGVDTAIRALALLASDYPDLGYAVAGEGEIRPSLEALARSLGVGHRVRFLGGVPEPDLPCLLNVPTVYLGVAREMFDKVEGFGIAIVEASASGVPVVGGTAGGIPDAVRDGETGLLTDPEDPAAIAQAVARLLDNEDLRARLGAGGRVAVETYYNWPRVTRDLRAIAAEVVH